MLGINNHGLTDDSAGDVSFITGLNPNLTNLRRATILLLGLGHASSLGNKRLAFSIFTDEFKKVDGLW